MNLRLVFGAFVACLFVLCAAAAPARAANFEVSPVTLTLSAQMTSGLFTLTNRSPETLRFHVSAFAWDQSPTDDMVLTPTTEVVFFPAMVVLAPGEERKLRIGLQTKPGAIEKTYRVFVQELPPPTTEANPNAVRVLTKMGMPVFVTADGQKPVPALSELALQGNVVRVDLGNTGTAHCRAERIVVVAKKGPQTVHREEFKGWYVLPGKHHTYTVTLPAEACSAVTSVEVEAVTDKGTVKAQLPTARCEPPR